jgi:cytochrome P450
MTDTVTDSLAAPLADPDSFLDGPPWELFRELRDREPVAWTPEPDPSSGFWSVTRHADIVAVSRNWQAFTSSRGVSLEELEDDQLEHRTSLIDTDPPDHGKLRKITSTQFLPRVINGYESFLRGIVARTMDNALPLGSFDFVEKVSSEIPVRVLARMLSVPDTDHAKLTGWGDRLVGGTDPEFAEAVPGTPEYDELRLVPFRSPAALEVFDYGRALQDERRARPTGDLISALVEARVDDEPLSQQDLDNYFLLLALAGQETTRQALTLAMETLIANPDVLARLQEQPELLSGPALDELLRWGAPVYHMRRTATQDATIGDQAVKAGDKIAIWFPSGNRDERAFDDADVLDLDRPSVDLLTFGKGGPHHCMGAFLAKMEYRVTLEELVARVDTVSYDGPVERLRSNFVNGIKRMPVTVTTR